MTGRQRTSSSAAKGVLAICAAAATLLFGGATWGQEPPAPLKTAKAGAIGTILVGPSGMTLYTFASDKGDGKSACTGSCARKWPPLTAAPGAPAPQPPLSLIARDDGTKQYAWKGKPLYYYSEDAKPGDTTGHEVGRSWFAARPD